MLQLLKPSPYAVLLLLLQSSPLQIIAFNHHYQRALKRIHPHVDTDYLRIRTSDYRRCLLRRAQSLRRTRSLIPIVIELLHLTDLSSPQMTPGTRLELLRADGDPVLQRVAIVWMVAAAREADPTRDVLRTTVTGDQGVKISIAGPSVG